MKTGRPLRVLYPFVGGGISGAIVSTAEMVRRLAEEGRVESVVLLPRHGPAADRFTETRLELVYLDPSTESATRLRESTERWRGKLRAIPVYLAMHRHARAFLERERIDVVHVNEDRLLLPWGMVARQSGLPVVWHVRQERPSRLLDRLRLRLADRLIFVADANRTRFTGVAHLPDSITLHNVVDLERFRPAEDVAAAKAAVGLDPERVVLTFVGNLLERKRPDWVLRAAALLQRDHPLDVVLVGAPSGSARYLQTLRELAATAPEPARIRMLGARDDVPDLFRASDLVTLPSIPRGEAFPRVVIEAMASGVPVVATDVAGVREALDPGVSGMLIDPADFGAYVAALDTLLRDAPARVRMGQEASRIAHDRFSGEAMGETLVSLYQGLVGAGGT